MPAGQQAAETNPKDDHRSSVECTYCAQMSLSIVGQLAEAGDASAVKFDEFEYLGDGWFRFPLTPAVVALAQVQKRDGRPAITYLVFSGDVGAADSARAIRQFPLTRASSVLGEAAAKFSESDDICDLVASIERVAH